MSYNPWRDPNPCDEGYGDEFERDAWADVPGSLEKEKGEENVFESD